MEGLLQPKIDENDIIQIGSQTKGVIHTSPGQRSGFSRRTEFKR